MSIWEWHFHLRFANIVVSLLGFVQLCESYSYCAQTILNLIGSCKYLNVTCKNMHENVHSSHEIHSSQILQGYGVVDKTSQCERLSCDIEVPKALFGLGFNNIRTLLIPIILLDMVFHFTSLVDYMSFIQMSQLVSSQQQGHPSPFP